MCLVTGTVEFLYGNFPRECSGDWYSYFPKRYVFIFRHLSSPLLFSPLLLLLLLLFALLLVPPPSSFLLLPLPLPSSSPQVHWRRLSSFFWTAFFSPSVSLLFVLFRKSQRRRNFFIQPEEWTESRRKHSHRYTHHREGDWCWWWV